MKRRLSECLDSIVDNRGRNPKYYTFERFPVIDNVMIKNNYYPSLSETQRYIDQDTHDTFLRGYIEKDMPIMTLVGGGIGNVALAPGPEAVIVQNTIGFKVNESILNKKYLYYWFIDRHEQIIGLNRGSGQPSIRKTDIEGLDIDLPNLEIQQKIVRILSSLDQKIELNNRQNSLITELLKLNYEKTTRGSNAKTKVALQNIFNFQEGPGIRNWQYVEKDGTRFINIRCIKDDDLDLSTANMISVEEANGKYAHFLLKEGDIVVSTSGTLGRSQIIRKAHLPLCLNTSVIRFWPKEPYYYSFMYCYIISSEFLHNLDVMATGSAQRNFGPMHLRQIDIDIMDNDAIKLFEKENRPLIKKLCLNRDENISLKNIRDTLLPKLMSGEIDLERISIND